ncbi:MAG: L,D-transpeptidase family protein [Sphingobacteriales bacterium]|nr:L,D-transpeptidase family protein [Sphingobacteriales bacterium]
MKIFSSILLLCVVAPLFFVCCKSAKKKEGESQLVKNKDQMDGFVQKQIKTLLTQAHDNKLDDTTRLPFLPVTATFYNSNNFEPVWSSTEQWKKGTLSFLHYLDTCIYDGLFKEDYQYTLLKKYYSTLQANPEQRRDAVLWAKADCLFSNSFFHVLQDIRQGRLQKDSAGLQYDSTKQKDFFIPALHSFLQDNSLNPLLAQWQPKHKDYILLKRNLHAFADSMDLHEYTYLPYPSKDSSAFVKLLKKRMAESGVSLQQTHPDSVQLRLMIAQCQQKLGMKADGKLSSAFIKKLNENDHEKLIRIAINLDRYKYLPATLPEKYIWVNIPSYQLQLMSNDSVKLVSKVIVGKPGTPTPELTGKINNLVTYPTWTVPVSIIKKDLLPGLKRNPGYLAKKGLALYTYAGEPVDPYTIEWNKYNKGIPFKVQQGSGDANALGVIKFNFNNPYDVYLHDTNQRYLFKRSDRSLSHGCVRVESWKELAFYIARNDSMQYQKNDTLRYTTDSISNWINRKEMHKIYIKNGFPVYIRYFTCMPNDKKIVFFDDIYNNDKALRNHFFTKK